MGRFDLASALTIDCHTGLCFYGHPRQCSTYARFKNRICVFQFRGPYHLALKYYVIMLRTASYSNITCIININTALLNVNAVLH